MRVRLSPLWTWRGVNKQKKNSTLGKSGGGKRKKHGRTSRIWGAGAPSSHRCSPRTRALRFCSRCRLAVWVYTPRQMCLQFEFGMRRIMYRSGTRVHNSTNSACAAACMYPGTAACTCICSCTTFKFTIKYDHILVYSVKCSLLPKCTYNMEAPAMYEYVRNSGPLKMTQVGCIVTNFIMFINNCEHRLIIRTLWKFDIPWIEL